MDNLTELCIEHTPSRVSRILLMEPVQSSCVREALHHTRCSSSFCLQDGCESVSGLPTALDVRFATIPLFWRRESDIFIFSPV